MQSQHPPNHDMQEGWQSRQDVVLAYSGAKKSGWAKSPLNSPSRATGIGLTTQRLLKGFDALGVPTCYVERPEIFATDISRRFVAPSGEHLIHLATADFEGLRLLKGAYNIAYVNWQYEAISTSTIEGEVFWRNQQWVLSRFDELWVGCTFLQDVLTQSGLPNVQVIPAPVPVLSRTTQVTVEQVIGCVGAIPLWVDFSVSQERNEEMLQGMAGSFSELSARLAGHGHFQVYLTAVDLEDNRNNAEALILAFVHFAKRFPDSLLVVKLASSSGIPFTERVVGGLRKCISRLLGDGFVASQSVLFIDDNLSEEEKAALMQSASFYVSTSSAEGNNLPILEAMAAETVLLAPMHTAMIDCLTDENCIICSSTSVACDGYSLTGFRTGMVTRHVASIANIYDALERSRVLSVAELELKRWSALQAVEAYALPKVVRKIDVRLDHAVESLKRGYV